ncbi:MAG: UDP-N-acetylmuramoyl-tripeptide--D-alanyl-D-alanine ligase [Pirellulaceae bacterium]|jgi:UDP-N-acetylmuramoyl-tripeptide--D-alanyl-D-alanine ligase
MRNLCIRELAQVTAGQLSVGSMPPIGGDLEPIARIRADSRLVEPGDVFWGLSGRTHDGSRFAEEAFARGAAGAVVCGRQLEPWAGKFSLVVEDTRWALWQLARWSRCQFNGRLIAITGSLGKSLTRQMITEVLAQHRRGAVTTGNRSDAIGVPLSLLEVESNDEYCVIEIAGEAPGQIDSLSHLCSPHIAVITCLADVHLDGFGDRETLAQSNFEPNRALPDDGVSVVNGDDSRLVKLARELEHRVVTFGRSSTCDIVADDVSCCSEKLSFRHDGVKFELPVWGRHLLTPALAAIAVAKEFGIETNDIRTSLCECRPTSKIDVHQLDGVVVIEDNTRNCPETAEAAFGLLRDFDFPGRRVVVFGEMQGLGDFSRQLHKQIGDTVVSSCGAELLVTCGEQGRTVAKAALQAGMPATNVFACETQDEVDAVLQEQTLKGDVVLMKGNPTHPFRFVREQIQRRWATPLVQAVGFESATESEPETTQRN